MVLENEEIQEENFEFEDDEDDDIDIDALIAEDMENKAEQEQELKEEE